MLVVLRQTKIYEIASCQIAAVTLLILTTTECRPNVIVTPLTDAEALVNQEGFPGNHVGFLGNWVGLSGNRVGFSGNLVGPLGDEVDF